MPIHFDLRENEILGPPYVKGLEEGEQKGLEKGLQKGRQEGRQEGELAVVRRLLEKRFGRIPTWAEERLAGSTSTQLEALTDRVLDAASLEDLLQ